MQAVRASAIGHAGAPWGGAVANRLPDGRLHLQHGPIDLVIEAWSPATDEIERAYAQAQAAFDGVLVALVSELSALRQPLGDEMPMLQGPVAKRMAAACWPHRAVFITPMAAVAGAVADEILAALVRGCSLQRASVNNGGDIALHLGAGEAFSIGIADVDDSALHGSLVIAHADPVRGVATSGWSGRSHSLGIADAVTVLAADGAAADAAATLIANAVNVEHAAIVRRPARELRDDSDLGDLLATVGVGALPQAAINAALDNGLRVAEDMHRRRLIHAACLRLRHHVRVAGAVIDGGRRNPTLRDEVSP